jgi:hypothetical protein
LQHLLQQPQMQIPSQLSPENAAEKFRDFNKSLPDGVRYEPLDEETMRILKMTHEKKMQTQPRTPMIPIDNIPNETVSHKTVPDETKEDGKNESKEILSEEAIEEIKKMIADEQKKFLQELSVLFARNFN